MKKVLVLSIFTLPSDVTASYRTMAYLKHFSKNGIDPTILTQFVTPKDSPTEVFKTGRIIRVPRKKTLTSAWLNLIESLPLVNKVSIFIRWMLGYLDSYIHDMETYQGMIDYCQNQLDLKEFDLIIGIFSPHHHLKLCYKLSKKYNIPYVLDFRDLWHNRIIHKNYAPSFVERLQDAITKYYWSKWLDSALFFTITSTEWMEKLKSLTAINGYVITNGFDREEFKRSVNTNTVNTNKVFTIIHSGSLYEHQDLDTFLKGAKLFLDKEKPKHFMIKFVGGDRAGGIKEKVSGFMYEPVKRIRQYLSEEYCLVTHRIPKNEMINELTKSDLLLFPSFPDAPGTYASKIFDYLGAMRPILMVPDDNGVVSKLIKETKSGFIANSKEEVYKILKIQYQTWLSEHKPPYRGGDINQINFYSRENQVKIMSSLIQSHLSDSGIN